MNLYITNDKVQNLSGVVVKPEQMCSNLTHLVLASRKWDTLFIDLDEHIPRGSLQELSSRCDNIEVCCPPVVSLQQMHLLTELFPTLQGSLRVKYMKGESVHGLLPKVWEHGDTVG